MKTLQASNVNDAMAKFARILLEKTKQQELLLEIDDCSLTMAILTPLVCYALPVEIREVSDIISSPSIPEGHRYRYDRNLIPHYKPNGMIDWQYSHITSEEIEALKERFEQNSGTDQCIMSFWYGPRDTLEMVKRTRHDKTKTNKPRAPCGLIWHYRSCRGGFQSNIFNRSIWYNSSFHADLLLPLEVGRYLTGRKPKKYSAVILNSKIKFKNNEDLVYYRELLDWCTFRDYHLELFETFKPYPVWFEGEFEHKESIEANLRVGAFKEAKSIADSEAEKKYNAVFNDWVMSMTAAELDLQQNHRLEMFHKWGVDPKHRQITIAKNENPWEHPIDPVFECWKQGQMGFITAQNLLYLILNEADAHRLQRLMDIYDKPVQRRYLLYGTNFRKVTKKGQKFWKYALKKYGVKHSLRMF